MKYLVFIAVFASFLSVIGNVLPNKTQSPFVGEKVRAASFTSDSSIYVCHDQNNHGVIKRVDPLTLVDIETIDSAKVGFHFSLINDIAYDAANIYLAAGQNFYCGNHAAVYKEHALSCIAKKLVIWNSGVAIGTDASGVYFYDPALDSIYQISTDPNTITDIGVISDSLWVTQKGLNEKYYFGPVDNVWSIDDPIFGYNFYYLNMGMSFPKLPEFVAEFNGEAVVAGLKIVAKYSNDTWTCDTSGTIMSMQYFSDKNCMDSTGIIYASCDQGITQIKDNQVTFYPNQDNGLPANSLGAICVSPDGSTIYHFCGANGPGGQKTMFRQDQTGNIVNPVVIQFSEKQIDLNKAMKIYNVKGALIGEITYKKALKNLPNATYIIQQLHKDGVLTKKLYLGK